MLILFSIFLANRCNNYFCYSYDEVTNGWELINFADDFDFSIYGLEHTDPLDLSPYFENDNHFFNLN